MAKAHPGHKRHRDGLSDYLVGGNGHRTQASHQHGKDELAGAAHQLLPCRRQANIHYLSNPGCPRAKALGQTQVQGAGTAEQQNEGQDCRPRHSPLGKETDAENQEVVENHVEDIGKPHDVEGGLHVPHPLHDGIAGHHRKSQGFSRPYDA